MPTSEEIREAHQRMMQITIDAEKVHQDYIQTCEKIVNEYAYEILTETAKIFLIDKAYHYLTHPNDTPESLHETWLINRQAEGWTYGQDKNHDDLTHPHLVEYNDLPIDIREDNIRFHSIVQKYKSTN